MSTELIISILAFLVSVITLWLTYFHRGTVKMTRPQFFALIPEDSPFDGWIKFFMRGLVFSTGQRGRIIEKMYVILKHKDKALPFHYWMYGDTDRLAIGSGIFVDHEGLAANHHFAPTGTVSAHDFTSGKFIVEVNAQLLGDGAAIRLFDFEFVISEEEVSAIRTSKDRAVYFTWDEEKKAYKSRIDVRKSKGRSHSVSGSGGGNFSWE